MFSSFHKIEDEVTGLLSELIKFDTTNPPGNEKVAADFLADTLREEGIGCEVAESSPNRGNFAARISGSGEKPDLLLLSHLDVVPAVKEEWSVDPFSGVVKDGFVWGRGALDCKSLTAVETVVTKLVKRNKLKLKGDLLLGATADEEKGGKEGVSWLLKNRPTLITAKYVINEGGGFSFPKNGGRVYTVQSAEKGVMWLKLKARGAPAHGSVPGIGDNALLHFADAVTKLGNHRAPVQLDPTVKRFLREIVDPKSASRQLLSNVVADPAKADQFLDEVAKDEKVLAELIRAQLRLTIAPTMIQGGIKENIIPSACEGVFDCRILPGQTKETLLEEIRGVVPDFDSFDHEFIQADTPSQSPIDTPLYHAIQQAVKQSSNSDVTPYMTTGGTDSRFLRRAGSVCYGFRPLNTPFEKYLKLVHGVDERISIQNLVLAVEILYRIVVSFLT